MRGAELSGGAKRVSEFQQARSEEELCLEIVGTQRDDFLKIAFRLRVLSMREIKDTQSSVGLRVPRGDLERLGCNPQSLSSE